MVPYIKATTLRTHYEDLQNIFDFLYPVGTVYWTSRDENPEDTFGFGKWEQIKDKFVWAKGDIEEENMPTGEMTHTLTTGEMPSHSHTTNSQSSVWTSDVCNSRGERYDYSGGQTASHRHKTTDDINSPMEETGDGSGQWSASGSGLGAYKWTGWASHDHAHNIQHIHSFEHSHGTDSKGGDTAHNNMPPYIIRYCWERVG